MPVRKTALLAGLWSSPEAALVSFLSALALGLVTPLLYYMIMLPDSIWIGLLVAVDCIGRIVGSRVLRSLECSFGYARAISIAQTAAALAYSIIAFTGILHAGQPIVGTAVAFVLIYLARFINSAAAAEFPSVVGLTSRMGHWTRVSIVATGLGFAVGCALTGIFADPDHLGHSILPTGRLVNPAESAAIVSAFAVVIAWRLPERERMKIAADAYVVGALPGKYSVTALAAEAAFGMTLVSAPLLQRETYTYAPVTLALFFAMMSAISIGVELFLPRRYRGRMMAKFAVLAGLALAALAFFGFATALQFSWVDHPFDGMWAGRLLLWPAGILAGLGHGLLRVALPVRLDKEFVGRGSVQGFIRLDDLGEIVRGAAALFAGAIWAVHERSSMAVPSTIAAIAIAWTLWPGAGFRQKAPDALTVV